MSELDERYGTSRRVTSNSSRWVWLVAAALFVGVVVFWALTALPNTVSTSIVIIVFINLQH